MRTLVRRLLILVAVGVVSGVLAYIVNGRDTSPSLSTTAASQLQRAAPAPNGVRPDLAQLESCLRAQGVTMPADPRDEHFRTALLACRQYLPAFPVDRDGDGRR